MKAASAWLRRQLGFSNSRAAWTERAGILGLFAVGVGGWWLSRGTSLNGRIILLGFWLVLACILMRAEIIHLLGPVFFFEILRSSRRRVHLSRVLYAGLLLASIVYVYLIQFNHRDPDELSLQTEVARSLFLVFFIMQMAFVGLLTPVIVAGCIAEEKERRTLEFVLATDLRGREIVLGKLAARVAGMLLLLLTGLPVLSFLEFIGGITPEELLAAMLVSVITLFSVAVVGITASVLSRRSRGAIISTFVILLGYLVLSGLAQAARFTDFGRGSLDIANWTVEGSDVIDAFQAGNPIIQVVDLVSLQESGAPYGDALHDIVSDYAIFHGIASLVLLTWSVLRLRPVALSQSAGGKTRQKRRRRLPAIGDAPMFWKEIYVERGHRLHLLLRIGMAIIVLASLLPALYVMYDYLIHAIPTWTDLLRTSTWKELLLVPFTDAGSHFASASSDWHLTQLQRDMNRWVRVAFAIIGSLMLLAITVRAAGSITGERARQTLDDLLATRLTNREIIDAKWIGSVLGVRRGFYWLGAILGLGLLTGGVSVIGAAIGVLALVMFALFFALLGLWFSARARNTFRSTIYACLAAIFALGGHWLFTALCCCLPMETSPREFWDESFVAAQGTLLGLTPPAVLGFAPMQSMTDLDHMRHDEPIALVFGFLSSLTFIVGTIILRSATTTRFIDTFGRSDTRRPEGKDPMAKFSPPENGPIQS